MTWDIENFREHLSGNKEMETNENSVSDTCFSFEQPEKRFIVRNGFESFQSMYYFTEKCRSSDLLASAFE